MDITLTTGEINHFMTTLDLSNSCKELRLLDIHSLNDLLENIRAEEDWNGKIYAKFHEDDSKYVYLYNENDDSLGRIELRTDDN